MLEYKKNKLNHPELYVVKFSKNKINNGILIFIHGGPGFNSGVLEFLIEQEGLFSSLDYDIVLYDQRGCGRSKKTDSRVSHADNINDLQEVLQFLKQQEGLEIKGLAGHSYGAKLLCDFYLANSIDIPAIFVAIASSMLTPRINNLLLDFSYLKKTHPEKYQNLLTKFNTIDLKKIWQLTDELAPLFQANPERLYNYWANLESMQKVQEIQKKINLPVRNEVFVSVRQDIYSNAAALKVDITKLKTPYLWINGFHDTIMNGAGHLLTENPNIRMFYQSAHYPHIEENKRFCEVVNAFLQPL